MLQFIAKKIDICKVSKILIKHNANATITNDIITINGDISEDLLTQILADVKVHIVRNFVDDLSVESSPISTSENISEFKGSKVEALINNSFEDDSSLEQITSDFDLVYDKVKRGEVYLCKMDNSKGSEQSKIRPAIIIQNDVGNENSPTTIVMFLTTKPKKEIPVHYYFNYDEYTVKDYFTSRLVNKPFRNCALAEQIRTVDKRRLRKYLGTMSDEFMENINNILGISLDIKAIDSKTDVSEKLDENLKDLNLNQIKALEFVDITKLFEIKESDMLIDVKINEILKAFGFDLTKEGMRFVSEAMMISKDTNDFTLDSICQELAEHSIVAKEQIHDFIVTRIKEKFDFKKFPTTDFIRLANSFLTK